MDYETAAELKRLQAALGFQALYLQHLMAEARANSALLAEALRLLEKPDHEISALIAREREAGLEVAHSILIQLANRSADNAARRGEAWWALPPPPGDTSGN